MRQSSASIGDYVNDWLKQPQAATGDTIKLKRPRPLHTMPVRRVQPAPRPSLLPVLVLIGLTGMLSGMAAERYPVAAFAWFALVVVFVWKLEQ